MKYLELLRLEVLHDYYPDQHCPDFEIEPTPATHRLLKNCRALLRAVPGGVRVMIPTTDQDEPFIDLPAEPTFSFHLRLQNPDFGLFTDLSALEQVAAPVYTNSGAAKGGELHLISREAWETENFVVQQPAKRESFVLTGRPLASLKTAGTFTVKGLGRKTGHKRYDEKARAIAVNSAAVTAGTPFTVTYLAQAQLERDVFADVEIKYGDSPATLPEHANRFQVVFKARSARWKYYVVTDKANNKAEMPVLEDKEKVVIFADEDRTDLTKTPDPADEIATELARQYPGKQYFRFVSNAPVPCRKAARKNIRFQLNGNKVIDSLPNPALQNYSIDARNATKEYTLYQVIKYFTH